MEVAKPLIPENLYYDQNDFWVKVNGHLAVVGMTDYGQKNTGDILYLEIAEPGTYVKRGEKCGSIESGKWVGNLLAPLSGVIMERNNEAELNPRIVNFDAYGEGWLYQIQISDFEQLNSLLTAGEYAEWTASQDSIEAEVRQEI